VVRTATNVFKRKIYNGGIMIIKKINKKFRTIAGGRGRYVISSKLELFKRKTDGLMSIPLVVNNGECYYPIWRQRHLVKIKPKDLLRLWKTGGEYV
jgi:hypothetical protein